MHAEISILGKYDFPFGHLYKMHHDNSVQCSAMQSVFETDRCQPQRLSCSIRHPYYQLSKQISFKRPSHTADLWTNSNLQVILRKLFAQVYKHLPAQCNSRNSDSTGSPQDIKVVRGKLVRFASLDFAQPPFTLALS